MRALAVLFRRGRTPPLPQSLEQNLKARKRSLEDQDWGSWSIIDATMYVIQWEGLYILQCNYELCKPKNQIQNCWINCHNKSVHVRETIFWDGFNFILILKRMENVSLSQIHDSVFLTKEYPNFLLYVFITCGMWH